MASGSSKSSAVSRLENKYSDVLNRRDRDKTLEPDENYNPLARSATSHQLLSARPKLSSSSFNASDRKERTPYRLQKNKSRYLGDSNDSGYLTTASTTNGRANDLALVDDNYPLDYGSSRYRAGARNYGNHYDHRYQDEYNTAGAGAGTRYSRQGEYASSYKPRSGLDYSNYYDGSRLGHRSRYDDLDVTTAGTSTSTGAATRQKAYGRNKTSDSLASAIAEASASGRAHYEPPPDSGDTSHEHTTNSRNRFAHKRPQMTSVGSSTHRSGTAATTSNALTEEELEILNDDRSSADNAAILLALRDDGQYLEAKKYEERMRKRTELKERMVRYAQEAEKAKELQQLQEEQEKALREQVEQHEKDLAAKKQPVTDTVEAVKIPEAATTTAAATEEVKVKAKKSRTKKVTTDTDDTTTNEDTTSSSSEEEEDDDEDDSDTDTSSEEATSAKEIITNNTTNNTTASTATTTTTTSTSTTTTTSTTVDKDQTDSKLPSTTTNNRPQNADKNNNDLSKYRPQPIPSNASSSSSAAGLMHSSSSGALAFGGISERLGAGATTARQQKPYTGATSRTAAVLNEFENSSRYGAATARERPYGGVGADSAYKSSYLYDPYTSAYAAASSSRRTGAAGAAAGSSYQRQQHAYQQQQQQLYQQNLLAKSATSSSLFHRSRIPKTYSSFVRNNFQFFLLQYFTFFFVLY